MSDPRVAPYGSIASVLWECAARTPERIAVVERSASTSYRELGRRACGFAVALEGLSIGPGDRVGIFLERGADAAAAFFGVTAVGGIAVIINETLRPRQIEHILHHAQARALVASADLLARQPRPLETGTILTTDQVTAGELSPRVGIGSDVAQIIYTSGSTGQPKGVTLTHANLWAGMRAVSAYLGITAEDRIASLLPFSFDYGFNQLLCAVGQGATLVVEHSPVPQQIAATLRRQSVTVLAAVPPLWLQLLSARSFLAPPLPSLRTMTNTGGRLPTEAVRSLRQAHPHARLFLMYGLTEAFRSTYLDPARVDRKPDSIGQAIPGAEVLVVDELMEQASG